MSYGDCSLLLLIANECYKTEQYLYAAKAFDLLGRMDDSPEFWEGKRGALVGVFQNVVSGEEPKETLLDIRALLQNSNKSEVQIHSPLKYLTFADKDGLRNPIGYGPYLNICMYIVH